MLDGIGQHVLLVLMENAMRRQAGSVMVMSYLLVSLFLAWGSATMIGSVNEQRLVLRSRDLTHAFHVAEAGLEDAMVQLRTGNAASIGTTSFAQGNYTVSITQPSSLASNQYLVQASGQVKGLTRTIEAVAKVDSASVFQFALFGSDNVRVKVNDEDDSGDNDASEQDTHQVVVDSYDSALGSYQSQTPGTANVGTNNTEEKSVRLKAGSGEGSITVNGQVAVGTGMANPSTAAEITGNVTVTGSPQVVSQSTALTLPAVTPPSSCGGKQDLKHGETLTLSENSSPYCFDKLKLQDDAAVIVQGNVVVYVGELEVKNDSQLNAAGKPTQLIVQVTSNKKVKLQDNVLFVGGLYAPASKAKIKDNVTVYGSIVATRIKVKNNADIHYDQALSTVGPASSGSGTTAVVSWREP